MCIQTRIERAQAQKAALDAQIQKLEQLETKTAPVKTLLSELLADYSDVAPEDLASVWQEILEIGGKFNLSVQPLAADELRKWEAANAENEKLKAEIEELRFLLPQFQDLVTKYQDSYGGIFNPDELPEIQELKQQLEGAELEITEQDRAWGELSDERDDLEEKLAELSDERDDLEEKLAELSDERDDLEEKLAKLRSQMPTPTIRAEYELATGNDASELSEAQCQQQLEVWEKETQAPVITEEEAHELETIPALTLWQPGEATTPTELTKLQKLLEGNSNFTFEELGMSVAIQSVIAQADDTVDFESEEALFTVSDSSGETREYYVNAEVYQCYKPDQVEQAALGYAHVFLRELKEEAKVKGKIEGFNKEIIAPEPSADIPLDFEEMGFQVLIYPQYAGQNLVGATFKFMSLEEKGADGKPKCIFSKSLLAAELGDRCNGTIARALIQDWRDKETIRLEKVANPYAKEEDNFIEFVKLSPAVGYIKRRDNGELISAYAAFSNRDAAGEKTETLAKPRAKKWVEHFRGSFESCGWKIDEPRKVKRMESEPGAKQQFAYEIKITGKFSIGQLQKLAEEDFSLLPNEIADKPVEPVTAPAPNFRVIVNGFEMASGKNEEVLARFEEELAEFGDARKTSVSLMRGSEVVERYAVADFNFIEAQDFDSDNPEYFVLHRPTRINLRVYRSITSGAKWVNSIYPHSPLDTKEAAAVDGVRRKLKAEKAE